MTVQILNLDWKTTLLRYFLMMFVVIVGVMTQVWALAFLGLPIFLSAILGIAIVREGETVNSAKMVTLKKTTNEERKIG